MKSGYCTISRAGCVEAKGQEKESGIPGTEQLMGLRLERYGRLEKTGRICQFVDFERTFRVSLFCRDGGGKRTYLYRVELSDLHIFLSVTEWCWMEAGPAFALSLPDPSASASGCLFFDGSCPAHPVFHRPPINLVLTFWNTPLRTCSPSSLISKPSIPLE